MLTISICFNVLSLIAGIQFISYKGGMNYLSLATSKFLRTGSIVAISTVATDKAKEFEKYQSTENDVIFLGDSIMSGGLWNEYFPGSFIRNRGISGTRTYDVINQLDVISEGHPHKIFLLVGINDLSGNVGNEKIVNNYEKIIKTLQLKTPKTAIYVGSILPTNKEKIQETREKQKVIVTTVSNNDIQVMNKQLMTLCNNTGVTYVDYYSHLLDSQGELKSEITTDGLHLNSDGYLILSKVIEQYMRS